MVSERNKLFLFDAMALIYRAHFAFSKNPRINSKGLNTSAIFGFTNTLLEVLKKEKPTHAAVAFDTRVKTFRSDIFSEYKANREKQPEDIQIAIPYIKQIISAFNIPVLEKDGYEADDIIGTIAKRFSNKNTDVYMMTPDKDFSQLVGDGIYLYKPAFMGRGVDILGKKEVLKKFQIKEIKQVIDFLGLQGDSVDNIPGVPGVGPKTATKLLKEYDSLENIINNSEKIKGSVGEKISQFSDQAILSKKLATIKTDVSISIEKNDLYVTKPNLELINPLFDKLEFRVLKNRLFTQTNPPQEQPKERQLDIFENSQITKKNYIILDKNSVLDKFLVESKNKKEICFDTETTGLKTTEAELVGIAFSFEKKNAYYLPISKNQKTAKESVSKIKPLLENKNTTIIGHNLKFDIQIMKKYNVNISNNTFDTMLAHYLLDPETSHRLDVVSENILGHKMIPIENLIGKKGINQKNMREVSLDVLAEYACEDADVTFRLKQIFSKSIKENKLNKLLYEVEQPLSFVLADMELEGVNIDNQKLHEMSIQLDKLALSTEKEIFKISKEEFNISSPKQLGIILFEKLKIDETPKKTKTGQYATGEDVLLKLSTKHQIVERILEYREYKKLKSTYVDALPHLMNKKDQRVHTNYGQAVTSTGRLSSNNPNLQNIPIKTKIGREIRAAFIPKSKNHLILSADYSQVELRIMAAFSGDKEMINAFISNQDIHATTASKVFKVPLSEVEPQMRRKAKEVNFGIIYGISPFGLSQNLSISRVEAVEIIESYFSEFPSVKIYMNQIINEAREKEYVQTILGRRRFLRDINSRNQTLRGYAERNAINTPIQGSAADIIKLAMINIYDWMKDEKVESKMIMQVHDELVFDIQTKEKELMENKIKEIMENVISLKVPLVVSVGCGKNWLKAH